MTAELAPGFLWTDLPDDRNELARLAMDLRASWTDPLPPLTVAARAKLAELERRERELPRIAAAVATTPAAGPPLEVLTAPDPRHDPAFEPAIDSLAGALDAAEHFVRRYVVFPMPVQVIAIVLWAAHTYAADRAETSPILAATSPEKRSGKTRLLDVLELLVHKPWRAILPSEAVVFRKIAADGPTLLLDEIDAVFGSPRTAAQHEGLRALLNAGNRRGTTVPRVVGEGRKMKVQEFAIYGPKAIAGIGALPDTVADRSIVIRLERRARSEPVERFRYHEANEAAGPIRAAFETLLADARLPARVAIPDELDDRAADGWEPLLAIADAAGGAWPRRARQAAVALSGGREPEDESMGVQLLADMRLVFDERASARLSTADLLDALRGMEESPWADWRDGRALNAHGLSRLLRPFGVRPRLERIDGRPIRGYLRDELEPAWSRYLPSLRTEPVNRYTVTASVDGEPDPASSERGRNGVTDFQPVAEGGEHGDEPPWPDPEDVADAEQVAAEWPT